MQVEVRRHLDVNWPSPIGPAAPGVLRELFRRISVPWFLMGRTLKTLGSGALDLEDSDIDIGIAAEHEVRVRADLDHWPLAVETFYRGRTQQVMWFPERVLVDCHVFYPSASYVSMKGKRVARPAEQFTPAVVETPFGDLPVPRDPDRFLFEDYGPGYGRWSL